LHCAFEHAASQLVSVAVQALPQLDACSRQSAHVTGASLTLSRGASLEPSVPPSAAASSTFV
jgi:hypothetical protein